MAQFTDSSRKQTMMKRFLQDLVEHAENRPEAIGALAEALQTEQDREEWNAAEEALRESGERFGSVTQVGRMFAYQWDLTSDVIIMRSRLNGDVTCMTGQAVLATVQPGDCEQVLATLATLRAENPVYRAVIRVSHPDGRIVWLETAGRASFDSDGTLIRMSGMVDMTETKGCVHD